MLLLDTLSSSLFEVNITISQKIKDQNKLKQYIKTKLVNVIPVEKKLAYIIGSTITLKGLSGG